MRPNGTSPAPKVHCAHTVISLTEFHVEEWAVGPGRSQLERATNKAVLSIRVAKTCNQTPSGTALCTEAEVGSHQFEVGEFRHEQQGPWQCRLKDLWPMAVQAQRPEWTEISLGRHDATQHSL